MTVTCAILMTEPSRGSVYFDSSPQGARIFIDGNDTLQYTPATVPDIVVGTHNFILTKAGYNNLTDTVDVLVNQTSTISATLIPSEGCIYFESTPAGAKIFIDDVDTGKITPDLVCELTLEEHNYRLVLTGYQDVTGTVNLTTGHGTIVTVILPEIVPANIVATAITPSVTTCTAPCNMTVDITWTNNGGTSGTFIPTITINGTPTALPEESLGPSLSTTKTFSLTGLMTGTYNICSDPNTFPCATVTVTSVAQAVFGAVGMFVMAGLAIGAIYAMTRKPKTETTIK